MATIAHPNENGVSEVKLLGQAIGTIAGPIKIEMMRRVDEFGRATEETLYRRAGGPVEYESSDKAMKGNADTATEAVRALVAYARTK